MTDEERVKDQVIKSEIERVLCKSLDWGIMDLDGLDVAMRLVCTSIHDFNKFIYKVLMEFEKEFKVERPENWRAFSDRVSKTRFGEDGKNFNEYRNLSVKARGLRDAAMLIATLADCFEYVEKAELKEKESEDE